MKAEDILNDTDPNELRNIIRRLKLGLDSAGRPPLTLIINEAPHLFPPSPSDTGFDLGWINVKDHGAVGDGSNDDTQAITNAINALTVAGRGVLYFPPGSYLTSGGFTISVPALILGCGQPGSDDTSSSSYVSRILCSSSTATLFTVTAYRAMFMDIVLVNTAAAPSAGAGITVTGSNVNQRVSYDNIYVHGFYIDIDIQVGVAWTMHNCILHTPVLYALKVRNTINGDAGDWMISNTIFSILGRNADAAIRIESSGGGKIINSKINGSGASQAFQDGIDLSPTIGTTGILLVSNCSIENVRRHGIRVNSSFTWHTIIINGIQFGLSWNTANNVGNAVNMSCTSVGLINSVVIAGCVCAGGATPAAISLTNLDNAKVLGNVNKNMGSLITESGCTNLVIIEPGTAVTAETSYGLASAVGTSGYYARQDHTHGSPALSSATPADVSDTPAPGSGTTPSKNDHVHEGVHAVNGLSGDVNITSGGHLHGLARWVASASQTTFELPDFAEYVDAVTDNGTELDSIIYSLSSDRTQIVLDTGATAGHIIQSNYVLAQA